MQILLADLKAIAPRASQAILGGVCNAINKWFPQYGIDTPLRICHFLAQSAHETGGFTLLTEMGSPSYFDRYQGRKDLGNVAPGDGRRFKGRGIFQLTGRVNYQTYGRKLGLDLLANPDLASSPDVSVRIACEYWKAKGLNAWADRDDVGEITRRINGGFNGLAERTKYLKKAKGIFVEVTNQPPTPMSLSAPDHPAEEVPDAPIASEPATRWWESTTIQATLGGYATSIIGAVNSPWGVGALIVIVGAAVVGYVVWQRMKREAAAKPV